MCCCTCIGKIKFSTCVTGENEQPSYIAMFVAEFVGTGLLMFLGCMGCIINYENEPETTHHMPSIAFGLTVMTIIQVNF